MAMPNCLRLLLHCMRAAASRTFCTAGNSRPMRMAMMAITTNSSISVKAVRATGLRIRQSPSLENKDEPESTPGQSDQLLQVEIEVVRALFGHFRREFGVDVVLGRNQFLGHRPGTGSLFGRLRLLALIGGGDAHPVFSRCQSGLGRQGILAIVDLGSFQGDPLLLKRREFNGAAGERSALEGYGACDGLTVACAGTAAGDEDEDRQAAKGTQQRATEEGAARSSHHE